MTNVLQLRPPRRHPRLLGIRATKSKLILISLDPWELRGMTQIKLGQSKNEDYIRSKIEPILIRERPHSLVVSGSKAVSTVKKLAKRFNLPVVSISAKGTPSFASLPACYRTDGTQSRPIQKVVAITYAGLLIFLQQHYAQRKTTIPFKSSKRP